MAEKAVRCDAGGVGGDDFSGSISEGKSMKCREKAAIAEIRG